MNPDIMSAILLTLKIFILLALILYSLFGAIMIRQEQLMAAVLEESFEPVLRMLVLVHFAASLILLAFAFFFL